MNQEIYYHIYNRGSDKRRIFMEEKDCERFLECLEFFNTTDSRTVRDYKDSREFKEKKNRGQTSGKTQRSDLCFSGSCKLIEIFCFCLMPNHFHLILKELIEGGIAKFMQKLSTSYVMYFNKKYGRSGGLFEGKYKSKEINADFYLTHLTGYIHINAVTAGLVKKPEQYKYSSYLDYLGKKKTDFLDFKPEELEIKIEDYKKFVLDLIKDKEALEKVKMISWEE